MSNRLLIILLQILSVYYCLYGLILFWGPLDPISLQNPETPIFLKIIDEAICALLVLLIVVRSPRYKFVALITCLLFAILVVLVNYFRIIEGYGFQLDYLKSLIISFILLLAFSQLEFSKFCKIIRGFIHFNAFALVLSLCFFISNPYIAYGGRLLGNYANPNTSSLIYTILITVLVLVGKTLYSSYKRPTLIISLLLLVFITGLITSFSKLYIAISLVNLFFLLPSFGLVCIFFILPVSILFFLLMANDNQTLDNLAELANFGEFLMSNTVNQRSIDYKLWLMEMNSALQLAIGRKCDVCTSFFSDSSFINLTSSYGFFGGVILLGLPMALMSFSALQLRKHNRKISKKYIAVYSCCYLCIFFHYQVEIQPTQFLFFLAALTPVIFWSKVKLDDSHQGL